MKKQLAIIFTLGVFANAFAGDRVGNGGDVIVCPDNRRTEVLDIFQGREEWGFDPITRGGTRIQIMTETLEKFSIIDPFIAKKLLTRGLEIEKELALLEADPKHKSKLVKLTVNDLVNIADEGVAELPMNCRIVQAATQNQNPFPGEVKFTFQKQTWLSLDSDVQASLVLHEVVYEHMISVGENASRSTRYLNSALHAGRLNSVKDYFEISSLYNFRNLNIIEDAPARKFKNCIVKRAWMRDGDYPRSGTTISLGRRYLVNGEENHDKAMLFFWQRHVSAGVCD